MRVFGFLKGQEKIFSDLKKLRESIDSPLAQALAVSAINVQATARKSIQKQHGRKVRRKVNGRFRTLNISNPGEPPTTKTGTLVRSIFWKVIPSEMKAIVGTPLNYGMFLEFGTTKMEARPWLSPALEAEKKKILEVTGIAVQKIMKKVIK